uniref:Telomere zinc finger-associated protein-like n=1 Tax=Diabrotica virgifera virgifera TaxID=50390 RepID=A0A6P7FGR3_DIAVI
MHFRCLNKRQFQCKLCIHACSSKGNLRSHIVHKHKLPISSAEVINYLDESLPFPTSGVVGSYECPNCNKRYRTKGNLNQHMNFRCLNKRQFRCKLCIHACSSKGNLRRHIVHKHKLPISSAEVINYLDESLSFPTSGGWHSCDICGKAYKIKRSLWRHKKYECGNIPAFECTFCEYRAKQKSHLDQHMRMHAKSCFDSILKQSF